MFAEKPQEAAENRRLAFVPLSLRPPKRGPYFLQGLGQEFLHKKGLCSVLGSGRLG